MKKYLVLYSGGLTPTSTTPQEREASMKVWEKWFAGLGKSVVDMGAPLAGSKTLSGAGARDGNGGIAPNGYSIVQANDLEAAAKLLKVCPIISEGGKLHVFEVVAM